MPQQVLKRGGYQEEFQPEKLKESIKNAARDAGYSDDEIFKIIEEISAFVFESIKDLDTVDTRSLRSLILSELDEKYPKVAEAWRKYDQEYKGRIE